MAAGNVRQRSEISAEYKWDIESMYDSADKWEADLRQAEKLAQDYSRFQGHLGDSAQVLADALEEDDRIGLLLERVFVYARMKLDEDNRAAEQQ